MLSYAAGEFTGYLFGGGHRFFTKVKAVDDLWREILEEEKFLKRKRLSGITDITERLRVPDVPNPVGYDGLHWSAEGNRRVAAIVKERLDH